MIWEGSEYRGRGRETIWDGSADPDRQRLRAAQPRSTASTWNKRFDRTAPGRLEWGGADHRRLWWLRCLAGPIPRCRDPEAIDTALVQADHPGQAEIGLEDKVFEAGGIKRRIRVFRLPDENPHHALHIERTVPLRKDRDNALYICLTQEDGHLVWSSPIYLIP